jgi:S1-C subfamily serine protease
VARIIVPEGNATSYGSGTLVDVREEFGLVITNWHVVRDGQGDVEVVFPDGFRSKARPLTDDLRLRPGSVPGGDRALHAILRAEG